MMAGMNKLRKKKEPKIETDRVLSRDATNGSEVSKDTQRQSFTLEGLFDIAYQNYRKLYPESNMLRRDFRRQIWGTDDIAVYLDKEQYGFYLDLTSDADKSEHVPVHAHISSEESHRNEMPAMEGEAYTSDGSDFEDILDMDPMSDFMALGDNPVSERLEVSGEDTVDTAPADLEPAFDESFLEETYNGNLLGESVLPEEESPENDMASNDAIPTYDMDEQRHTGNSGKIVKSENNVSSEPEQETSMEDKSDDSGQEEEKQQSMRKQNRQAEKKSDRKRKDDKPERNDEVVHADDIVDHSKNNEGVDLKQYNGVFSHPGVMQKLRRSMFLDEEDSSMDVELLQLSTREVFEQLIRLEGCVRKVSQIGQIAEMVFGDESNGIFEDSSLPSQERLVEIVNAAAEFMSIVLHPDESDGDDDLNEMICQCLGLTDQEREKAFVKPQRVRRNYVVFCSDEDSDEAISVMGEYTDICRAAFLFEQAHAAFGADDFGKFLTALSLDWQCLSCEGERIEADILISDGKVTLV